MSADPSRRRVSGRAATGAIVLIAWIAGLGLLARRELFRGPVERLAEAAMRVNPSAVFFEVTQGGKHIGYASTTIDTASRDITVRDVFVADLTVGGGVHRASVQSLVTLSRRLALRTFEAHFVSDSSPISVVGEAEGDSVIVYSIITGVDSGPRQRLQTDGPILLPTLVPIAVALGSTPKVGARYTIPIFDPTAMASRDVVVSIVAESLFTVPDSAGLDAAGARWIGVHSDTVRAWKLTTESRAVVTGWVDEHGRLVESEQPGGIVVRRTAYELAFENWRIDRQTGASPLDEDRDVMETTAIAASVPFGSAQRERLRARLSGVSLEGFNLGGGRQQLSGDVVTVQREGTAELTANWTRSDRSIARRFSSYLRQEPLLEVDHTEIREAAVRIAGNETDPRILVEKLNRWVHDSLRKVVTVSVPSALQVLRNRSGDCNEHTQLYVALARALRIPARGAAGLAYVNGKFYYHAWPEVFLGTWVAVDPTFGQMPADAGHLRFVTGGLGRQTELLRLMGSLRIDILDTR